MAVETETKEKEETTAEKLAKSSGADTDKYSEQLEAEADAMLDEVYRPEKFEEDQKAIKEEEEKEEAEKQKEEEKKEESGKEETEEKEAKPAEDKKDEVVDDEIKADDEDTVAELKDKLVKSEQRVKDNRKAFSTSKRELSDERIASKAVVNTFKQTIEDLQGSISQKAEAGTKQEEKVADKEIQESVIDLKAQFEKLNAIDPDIAAPIKEIIEGLTGNITGLKGQISNLETEIKTKEETASKSAQESADDAHYAKIDDAHPDNEEITGSDEFNEYVEGLSPRNKRLAQQDLKGGSAENIIELIDDYKESAGIKTEKSEEIDTTTKETKNDKTEKIKTMVGPNLNKAKEVKTSKKVKYTRAMLKERHGDTEWFAKHETDIDKEMAAGNIPDY